MPATTMTESSRMVCPLCDTANDSRRLFCAHCGRTLLPAIPERAAAAAGGPSGRDALVIEIEEGRPDQDILLGVATPPASWPRKQPRRARRRLPRLAIGLASGIVLGAVVASAMTVLRPYFLKNGSEKLSSAHEEHRGRWAEELGGPSQPAAGPSDVPSEDVTELAERLEAADPNRQTPALEEMAQVLRANRGIPLDRWDTVRAQVSLWRTLVEEEDKALPESHGKLTAARALLARLSECMGNADKELGLLPEVRRAEMCNGVPLEALEAAYKAQSGKDYQPLPEKLEGAALRQLEGMCRFRSDETRCTLVLRALAKALTSQLGEVEALLSHLRQAYSRCGPLPSKARPQPAAERSQNATR